VFSFCWKTSGGCEACGLARAKEENIMSSLLARALFLPSLAYNVLMEKVSSREWYNTVDHNLILGALPLRWTTREVYNHFMFANTSFKIVFLVS